MLENHPIQSFDECSFKTSKNTLFPVSRIKMVLLLSGTEIIAKDQSEAVYDYFFLLKSLSRHLFKSIIYYSAEVTKIKLLFLMHKEPHVWCYSETTQTLHNVVIRLFSDCVLCWYICYIIYTHIADISVRSVNNFILCTTVTAPPPNYFKIFCYFQSAFFILQEPISNG